MRGLLTQTRDSSRVGVASRNDQVFQLSLTEIAFTVAFILLLLLGYLVMKEQGERKEAQAKLVIIQSSARHAEILSEAKKDIAAVLQRTDKGNAAEAIKKLIDSDAIRVERDALLKKVEDLDAKLTALTELRNKLASSDGSAQKELVRNEIETAIALQGLIKKLSSETAKGQRDADAVEAVKRSLETTAELKKQLKSQLNKELLSGREAQTIKDIVDAARSYGEIVKSGVNPELAKKENADLKGQVEFLKNKLARGGLDYPPCWADEKGKIQFLFAVEVRADSVVVERAWLPVREADAMALPGIGEVLSGSPHSNANFVTRVQGIFKKSQELKCRHYVRLKSSISDAILSDRARLMVENYFYKDEMRR